MTTVRIAHAEPRPGQLEHHGFQTLGWLVVLADDAGHRAVPVWLREEAGGDLESSLRPVPGRPRRSSGPTLLRSSPPACCARPAPA